MREPYVLGERLEAGQVVILGKDGKLYKTGTMALFKEPKRPALIMPKGTLKEVKNSRKKKEKKQPKTLTKDPGTFMTEKTKAAREARQKLLQDRGQADGMADIDYGMDDDAKQKALRGATAQVVVNGGFDPKIKEVTPGRVKSKKRGQDEENGD